MSKNIMALDQGITSSRTILYNEKGEPIALAQDSGIKIKNVMVELTDKKNFYFWFRLALFGLFWFQWLQFSYSQTGGHRQANLRVTGNRHFSYWIPLQILFEYIDPFGRLPDADI